MLKYETFLGKKKVESYNENLIELSDGYADIAQIGLIDDHQIFKLVINPEAKRTICFIAGLHGDEPAGPLGVLKFLEKKLFIPPTKKVVILPLVNPTGYELDKRENGEGIDVNRQFLKKNLEDEAKAVWIAIRDERPVLLHTLHEDPDAKEFYAYYTDHKELAEELKIVAKKYFKIHSSDSKHPKTAEVGKIYDDKVLDGLIPLPHVKRGGIEDRVYEMGMPYITTESPGKAILQKRIDFNADAIKTTIFNL